MLRLVVFDLDDTLYDTRPFFRCALHKVALFASKKYKARKNSLLASLILVLDEKGPEYGRIFNDAFSGLGISLNASDLKELIRVFYSHSCYGKMRLRKGAAHTLACIRKTGVKCVILTKGGRHKQAPAIKSLNLRKKVDRIFYAESMGYNKSNPKLFKRVLQEMNCDGPRCLVIGNNPMNDLAPAKAFGANTLRLMAGFNARLPKTDAEDFQANDFPEILKIFYELNSK